MSYRELDDAPVGAIPRVEHQETHYKFLWEVRPPYAMVDLTHASRIVMNDTMFFPEETSTILTSTISDSDLSEYTFKDELRIVRKFNPDFYIPFDFPVYSDMPSEDRQEFVTQVATGTRDMATILDTLPEDTITDIVDKTSLTRELVEPVQDTTIIPLIKGTTPEERDIMLQVATDIDAPCIAKYGVQYMTIGGSGNFPALNKTLHDIHKESNGYPTIVIGLLSPTGKYSLEQVPENVIGGAGLNQWRKRIDTTSQSIDTNRNEFLALDTEISEVLNTPVQYTPEKIPEPNDSIEFTKQQGHAVSKQLSPTLAGIAGSGEYGFGQRKRPPTAVTASEAGKRSPITNGDS